MTSVQREEPKWPAELAALVQYQPAAIVSRAIVQAAGGSVTLFAFDEGQHLSEHTAPFDALAHVLEGAATVVISGVAYQVEAGQAILMPANKPHAVQAQQHFKMVLTMIRS
ncbi:MAG: cupin domain-containing protein [bacterium]|jgi:quercetin dioxygenase-like cupin family protein|nr:cupin domain-containing protein [candidate division KSB1 bacterium]MDH7560731.1 cupin domain-containing protein [bacterium]